MIKVLDKWNDNGNDLKLVNFKMDNADFNTVEWYGFKGEDSTLVIFHHTDKNENNTSYKVSIHKEYDFSTEETGYLLEFVFHTESDVIIVKESVTRKQFHKMTKDVATNKLIKAFYKAVIK